MNDSETKSTSGRIRVVCLTLILAALQLACCAPGYGQGVVENLSDQTGEPANLNGNFFSPDGNFTFWINNVQGRGVGDIMSNTSVGANRFQFLDNGLRMFTAEFQITEYGDPDLSLGFQRRFWLNDDTAAGAGFYYDAMQSFYGNTFQQTGVNFEIFRDKWTVRSDFTFPVGQISQNAVSQAFANNNQPVFQGNNIGFSQLAYRIDETAMRGIDIEIARSVGSTNSEVYVGYHNFDGEFGPRTDGINGGFRGNITRNLATDIGIADDPLFGTNVFGGFTWFFGNGQSVSGLTVEDKMTIPVERNQQVVLNEVQTQMFNNLVLLTSRGQAITINHINSGANGDGTFENPYGDLISAEVDPEKNNRDIVYVHSGSQFNNEGYGVAPNQRFIGEGDDNNHLLETDQLGVITIPQVNGNQFARPVINVASVGLAAHDNTEISNIRLQGGATGITVNNVNGNVNVNRSQFGGSNTSIDIQGGSGQFAFSDLEFNANGVGIRAQNIAGNVNVNRALVNAGVVGIDIIGGTGRFTFTDVETNNLTTAGIRSNNLDGDVNVNRGLFSSGNTGIDILGGSGQFTFTDTDFNDQSNSGISVNGGAAGLTFNGSSRVAQSTGGTAVRVTGGHNGVLTFNPGSLIDSSAGDGLRFDDADGQYDFGGQVTLNGGDAGIDILGDSAGTFTFSSTDITDPTGTGINVEGGSSTINFDGLSSITKANAGSTVRVAGGHNGVITFGSQSTISTTGGDGLQFDNADGEYNFEGQTRLVGADAGIDILGDSAGTFTFSNTEITNPSGAGIDIDGGSSTFVFDDLSRLNKSIGGSAVRVGGGHNGVVTFGNGTGITVTGGDGLQFDDADGTYDFRGQVTLNGGDAGIDILGGSAGTFTFTDTTITNPTGTGINIDGGSSTVTFEQLSSVTKSNPGSAVNVEGGHTGTLTFDPTTRITATDGDGLQFDNADGEYDFRGQVQLNGGDAGIDILGDSAGTFTFTDTTITNPTGTGLNVDGGSSGITFSGLSTITKDNFGSAVNVQGGHIGRLVFENQTRIDSTDGDGLQFDNADGEYDFRGQVQLNGGDAGIDILGGSAGTFTFSDTTTITNPTGAAFNVQDLEAGGTVNYNGSIESNNDVIFSIDTTAPGTAINFNNNGANSLTSTDNPNGAMFIFDGDGDITVTTPMTVIRPQFSSLFATDGDGTWTFNDMTITDQSGLNAGIDVFGNMGVVNFTNLNITTDSAGTGDATTGFLAGGNNEINVFGNSNINADGGGALVLININTINMTWNNVTSTNNLNSQIGFAGDDGIDLLNVVAGTLDITGLTEVRNADGVAISIEDTGATVTFEDILLDTIGLDAIISGVAFDSAGIVNINGGTVNNTGQDGARIGSNFGSGVLGGFNLNNVTFTNIGGSTVEAANSVLSGSGNIDTAFSCTDFGGNIGKIFFNGGADSCPN